MPKLLLVLALLLIGLFGLSALTVSGQSWPRADFRFINRGDILTLDLNQMSYAQDFRVTYLIREGLYSFDQRTMQGRPALVTHAETSPDGRVWTFQLRPDARWSNGDPLTAADFVFSWKLMLESPGEYTSLFYYIANAEAYQQAYAEGKALPPDKPLGVEALGAHTLRVTLVNPLPFFTELLAFPVFSPRHAASMAPFRSEPDARGRVTYDNRYTKPGAVVTNGPFRFVLWRQGDRLRFEKNPYYWDADNVRLGSVEMVVNNDPLSAFQQYELGDVDWMVEPPNTLAFDLKRRQRPDLIVGPGFGTSFLTINVAPTIPKIFDDKNPLADLRLRRALNLALDKKVFVDSITRLGDTPATNYVPPGIFVGYQAPPGESTDVTRARELLADMGHPGGAGLPPLTLSYNTGSATAVLVAQAIKSQWESNLGLRINLSGAELKGFRASIKDKRYAIGIVNWFGDYPDPSTFTDKYRSTSENNDSNWNSPEYDALLDAAAREPDAGKRLRLLEQAETMINTQLPIIPLYHPVNSTLIRPYVRGIVFNPMGTMDFRPIHVDRAAGNATADGSLAAGASNETKEGERR